MPNTNQIGQDEQPRHPQQLRYLRSKIIAKPPYCQGTLALPESNFTLFYGTEGNAHRINLSAASDAQLQHLADTCAPATFGVTGEDVYDETYRKAGKLDNKDFSIGFDVSRSSLVDVIRAELLVENPEKVESEDLNIELYKLDVYGKDAFFKAHVDTPRSELLFGSLVIVFPTPHEGGALKLRAPGPNEESQEWTFDSSALLAAQQDKPSIAYVAFFSDVKHEVMPVISGHRVTITYNLYYALAEPTAVGIPHEISTNEQSFRDALHAILQDPSFLPDGGNLMFGLQHQYPLATAAESARRFADRQTAQARARESAKGALRALEGRLKATDGVILRVLRECALEAKLKVLYEAHMTQWSRQMGYVMADGVLPLPQMSEMIESAVDYLKAEGGEAVQNAVVLMARAIEREKAKAEAKVRVEARARAKAEAKAKEEAQAQVETQAKADKDEDKGEEMSQSQDKNEDEDDEDDEDEDNEDDEDEDEDDDEDDDESEYMGAYIPWYRDDDATPVYWVTDPPIVRSGKGFEKTIQTYGNEPALDVVYWRIWIFARVGPARQRETAGQQETAQALEE